MYCEAVNILEKDCCCRNFTDILVALDTEIMKDIFSICKFDCFFPFETKLHVNYFNQFSNITGTGLCVSTKMKREKLSLCRDKFKIQEKNKQTNKPSMFESLEGKTACKSTNYH